MTDIIAFVSLGLLAGILSGLLGIGGGLVMVPALALIFGMTQHQAQGTTLAAMIPPVALLSVWIYYKQGDVDLKVAGLLCAGLFIGGYFGAKFAMIVPQLLLRRIFGVLFLAAALRMIFGK